MAARAAQVTAHVPIEPHRLVGAEEHPRLQAVDAEPFEAETVVWSWRNYGHGIKREASLHDHNALFCLSFADGTEPDWVPQPPPEWDTAARALIDTMRGVL